MTSCCVRVGWARASWRRRVRQGPGCLLEGSRSPGQLVVVPHLEVVWVFAAVLELALSLPSLLKT